MKKCFELLKLYATTRRLLVILGLLGLILIPVVFYVYNENVHISVMFGPAEWGQFGDFVGGVTNPLLAFLTFIGVLWTISITYDQFNNQKSRQEIEDSDKRSEFFFEQAKSGLEEVLDMLKDQNNDRVTWIKAARDLLRARTIGKSIIVKEYQEAYRLAEEKIRHKLYLALSTYDPTTHSRMPLPPQFFYGVQNWNVVRPLDEVAKDVSQKTNVYGYSIDQVTPQSSILPLDSKSVVAIYDFLEYPPDYDDPLKTVERWADHWEDSRGINEGAKRFVYHVSHNMAIGGKLFPVKGSKTSQTLLR